MASGGSGQSRRPHAAVGPRRQYAPILLSSPGTNDRVRRELSINGAGPDPQLACWKDTVYVPPGASIRLALRFTDHADPDTPYMYHCHLHEDAGML